MRDTAGPALATLQRARGRAEVAVSRRDGRVRLDRLYQEGCAKARLPRPATAVPEVVLINTAGGITGGDRLGWSLDVGPGASLVTTTQAAERIYRSSGETAQVATHLAVGARATLDWLPQETIIFDGGRLERSLVATVAEDARLTALETLVLGRAARGETVQAGALSDQWRIRRGGRLVHAEALRIDWDGTTAGSGATLGSARAIATLVEVGPAAGLRLDAARRALEGLAGVTAAASAKASDVLVVRLLAADAQALRAGLIRFLMAFREAPLPRVWTS